MAKIHADVTVNGSVPVSYTYDSTEALLSAINDTFSYYSGAQSVVLEVTQHDEPETVEADFDEFEIDDDSDDFEATIVSLLSELVTAVRELSARV